MPFDPEERKFKVRWGLLQNPGQGEVRLAQELLKRKVVCRQWPILKYFVDIAIPDLKVVVEVDHRQKKMNKRQLRRQAAIEAEGWTMLRIYNDVAIKSPQLIWDMLWELKST